MNTPLKQIFDWLREAILDKAYNVYDGTVGVDIHDVGNIINEAEAKWEAECCEWKLVRLGTTLITDGYRTTCGNSVKNINSGHLYCGYCGKPIKISEVE